MYRDLINSLTYVYSFICRAKGVIDDKDISQIVKGASVITATAPAVEFAAGKQETDQDRAYYAEARKICEHIEDMEIFLLNMEIC